MALDPSIALAYRPPQVNVDVPNPIQQFGQVLSLRNLMQQGQLGQLGLQSKQLELQQLQQKIEEQKNISKILADEWGARSSASPAPTDVTPLETAPIAPPPAGQPTSPGDFAPVPSSAPAFPSGFSLLPNATPPPSPQPGASLSALMTQPQTAPAITPAVPATAIPQAAAQAPTLGFSPNVYRRIIQEAPLTGPAYVEGMTKMVNAQYDQLHKQYGSQSDAASRESTLIQGINDEPTKLAAVAEMSKEGLITPPERDHMLALPFNSPYFKSRADMALSRSEYLAKEQKVIEEERAAEKSRYEISQRPVQEAKAKAELSTAETAALQGELTAGAQSFGTVTDPNDRGQVFRWLGGLSPGAQKVYFQGLSNLPPNASGDDIRNMVGRTQKEYLTKTGETQAEQAKYQPTVNRVISGEQPWENLDPETQKVITPMLNAQGFTGIAQKLSDAERERLGSYDRALTIANGTIDKLKDQDTRDLMGIGSGLITRLPAADEHKKLQSHLLLQQQGLKKFITDGSIRGLTPETLDKIFPNITTRPGVADSQLKDLVKTITDERDSYIRDLSGKAIPKSMLPKAPIPPAAGPLGTATPENIFGPSQVKIVSPEAAAASSQPPAGLAPAQQAVFPKAAPPPGKMAGVKSDGKGGWKGVYFNAKDTDEARRQGVIF